LKLLYLTATNLGDRLFLKDLVHNFKLEDKALLLHEPWQGNVRDTRFATKRLSALLSETMVYNNAFSGDQRRFFAETASRYEVNTALIEQLLSPIQCLILGPVVASEEGAILADPLKMIAAARDALDIDELILFPANPLSPLVNQKKQIADQASLEKLLAVYDEEAEALRLTYALGATLASPTNFAQ
jgi:DNA-binding NtrC family response regulator